MKITSIPSSNRSRTVSQRITAGIFFITILIIPLSDVLAQRITYEYLRTRDRQPNVFFEHHVVPGADTTEMNLVTTFRLENNFLSFRRMREDQQGDQVRRFYAEPTVRLDIRKRTDNAADRSEPGPAITRTWSETIYTETYEQTQSATSFHQNLISESLQPGRYRIESSTRADSRTRRGMAPSFRIPDSYDSDLAFFYFLDEQSDLQPPFSAPLMNMGRNVYFGRDHKLAVWFPNLQEDAEYSLDIYKVRISRNDTTVQNNVFEYDFDPDHMLTGYVHDIIMEDERPRLILKEFDNEQLTGNFYLLQIPNSTFENAHYRIRLVKNLPDGNTKTITKRTYQSLWLDMPVSLLNLDVAIEMMRYIVDDDTHRELRRGNRQQREERFRRFWSERDPSPENEYNELMVEFYRRIDYAYDNFTTPQKPGYESDQGKIYVRHGEPDSRERTFPPNQPAREVWHYSDRSFVFEATTGFGDFRLIDRR